MREREGAVVFVVAGTKKRRDRHLLHAGNKARRGDISLGDDERNLVADGDAEQPGEVTSQRDVETPRREGGEGFFSDGLRDVAYLGFFRGINAAHERSADRAPRRKKPLTGHERRRSHDLGRGGL